MSNLKAKASPVPSSVSKSSPYPIKSTSGGQPSSLLRTIFNLLLYLYIQARRYLSVTWIKLNRAMGQPDYMYIRRVPSPPPTTPSSTLTSPPSYHRAIVIGDGLALGLGDGGVIFGSAAGIVPHIQHLTELDPTIRRLWKIVNRGEFYNSTTNDWLPSGGKLYESIFGGNHNNADGEQEKKKGVGGNVVSGVGYDAEIVIILLGTTDVLNGVEGLPPAALQRDMMDVPYPPQELSNVVTNIALLAKDLQLQGKRVCVVDMPTNGIPNANRGKMRRLNQQLRQVVNETNQTVIGGGGGGGGVVAATNEKKSSSSSISIDNNKNTSDLYPIQYVSLGNNHKIMMRSEYRAFDSLHLNRKGYRHLAVDMFNNCGLKSMFVNVEWKVWKQELNKSSMSNVGGGDGNGGMSKAKMKQKDGGGTGEEG